MSITKTLLVTTTAILASAAVLATSIEATMSASGDEYSFENGRFAWVDLEDELMILHTWPSERKGKIEVIEYVAKDWVGFYYLDGPVFGEAGQIRMRQRTTTFWSPMDRLALLNLLPEEEVSPGTSLEGRFGKCVVKSDKIVSNGDGFVRTIEVEGFSDEHELPRIPFTYEIRWSESDQSDRTLKRVAGFAPNESEIEWTDFRPIGADVAEAVETKGIPLGTLVEDLRMGKQGKYKWSGTPREPDAESGSPLLWLGLVGITLVPAGFAVKRFAK